MKRINFYNSNRSGDVLHIETEGCIINIRVNLTDNEGRPVTSIGVKADDFIGGKCRILEEGKYKEKTFQHIRIARIHQDVCKCCGERYSKKEVKRVYGESGAYRSGCCSASCYTKSIVSEGK